MMNEDAAKQVILFHDNALLGEYLESTINEIDNLEVATKGDNFSVIRKHITQTAPDIVVFSVHNALPYARSIETTLAISPRTRILLVTTVIHAIVMYDVLQEDAVSYINAKNAAIPDLKRAVIQVTENRTYRDDSFGSVSREQLPASMTLTSREQDVFWLLAEGYTNSEVAYKLSVSDETVKSHCRHIFHKLGLFDRSDIIYITTNGEPPHNDHVSQRRSSAQ